MKPNVLEARIKRIQKEMALYGLDGLFTFKPQHSYYLSGFNPIIYSMPAIVVLPVKGQPILLIPCLRDNHAREETWVEDIRLYGKWGSKPSLAKDPLDALKIVLEEQGLSAKTLGFEEEFLATATYEGLKERLPKATFKGVSALFKKVRMVKDEEEIASIRKAADIADAGMKAGLKAIMQRKTEAEICAMAEATMKETRIRKYPEIETADFGGPEGGVIDALWCWCLTGPRITYACDSPRNRRAQLGELLLLQIWTTCNGYHAENERTVGLGYLGREQRKAFQAMLEAREEALRCVRPGATCADVYLAAKRAFVKAGYERYLPGRIGHGLGLGAHEPPSITPNNQTILLAGMVITVEPGLLIEDFGGVRHSDTVLVTEKGSELLTQTERGLLLVQESKCHTRI